MEEDLEGLNDGDTLGDNEGLIEDEGLTEGLIEAISTTVKVPSVVKV